MTDNEIIKALECCFTAKNIEDTCAKCPYHKFRALCKAYRNKDMLNLINRQKAEIESLGKRYKLAVAEREANVKGFTEMIETAKAEAVKEFAERLKKRCRQARYSVRLKQELFENTTIVHKKCDLEVVDERDIDNLVKEMVGEE